MFVCSVVVLSKPSHASLCMRLVRNTVIYEVFAQGRMHCQSSVSHDGFSGCEQSVCDASASDASDNERAPHLLRFRAGCGDDQFPENLGDHF